jgi:hypothetical protein
MPISMSTYSLLVLKPTASYAGNIMGLVAIVAMKLAVSGDLIIGSVQSSPVKQSRPRNRVAGMLRRTIPS